MNLFYFAYGSNMATVRLRQRLPAARCLGRAEAPGFRVVFHKVGFRDGSGKCGLLRAGENDLTQGVLYALHATDIDLLDRIEGVGHGYQRLTLTVRLPDARQIEAVSYLAIRLDPALKPFHWYKQHLLAGASEHALPEDYLRLLAELESVADPDSARHAREMAIHGLSASA